ncbi:MAG: hypothetical protein ACKVPJ_00865 [Chitinophagales bacterium]
MSDSSGLSCHLEILTNLNKSLGNRSEKVGILEVDISTIRGNDINADVDHDPDFEAMFYPHTLVVGNKPGGKALTNDEIRHIINNKLYRWVKEPKF